MIVSAPASVAGAASTTNLTDEVSAFEERPHVCASRCCYACVRTSGVGKPPLVAEIAVRLARRLAAGGARQPGGWEAQVKQERIDRVVDAGAAVIGRVTVALTG